MFPLFLGQVLGCLGHHCLELFVRLLALLVICLQHVVVREVIFVSVLKVFELFSDSILCPKLAPRYDERNPTHDFLLKFFFNVQTPPQVVLLES